MLRHFCAREKPNQLIMITEDFFNKHIKWKLKVKIIEMANGANTIINQR